MASTSKQKLQFKIKRFWNFLKALRHSKRGMFGITILLIYLIVALGAPLWTPYDPITTQSLAGELAEPAWFKYLPGSDPNISENFDLLAKPGFDTLESWNEWEKATNSSNVQIVYDKNTGATKEGSVKMIFESQAEENLQAQGSLIKTFYYPYKVPKRFVVTMKIMIQGDETTLDNKVQLKLPINMSVFIEQTGVKRFYVWSRNFTSVMGWSAAIPPIDSNSQFLTQKYGNAIQVIMPEPGDYTLGIETRTQNPSSGQATTAVYIDDIQMRIDGARFGLLGTDVQGRDIFTQLVYGARISLFVGFLSAILSIVIGLAIGLIAGYLGGIMDEILMRFTDLLLVIPSLPLLLVLVTVLGESIWNVIFVIGVLGWMGFARLVRSQILSLKERPFVEAAKAVGAGKMHIMINHLVPNVMGLVYITLALGVPSAIFAEAALSWLGLFDPSIMSWGRMLNELQAEPTGYKMWWWAIPPGLSIAAISTAFILLGYALDEILNPKLRVRR